MYNEDADSVQLSVVQQTCDGTSPAISWFEDDNGPAVDMRRFLTFDACTEGRSSQLGIVRMDVKLSHLFTQVAGGFSVQPPKDKVLGDFSACAESVCTKASPWGHGVGGILFGTVDTVLKRGGELGSTKGSYETPAVEVPPTDTLRLEVSGLSTTMELYLTEFQVKVYQSLEDTVPGLYALYDFDTAPRPRNIWPSQVPRGVDPQSRVASCGSACPEWTPRGIAGGGIQFTGQKVQPIVVSGINATRSGSATLAFWFKAQASTGTDEKAEAVVACVGTGDFTLCVSYADGFIRMTRDGE